MLENRRKALHVLLSDPDVEVQRAAAGSLDAIEAAENIDLLLQRLQTGNRGERIAAAFALERVSASKVFAPLLELLQSTDPDLRLVAVQVLGAKKHPKTLGPLVKMLEDSEPGIQVEAARALAGFSDRRLPGYLAPLLKQQEQVALAAIGTLGLLAFPEGEQPLIEALGDERVAVRRKAAQMLGRLYI